MRLRASLLFSIVLVGCASSEDGDKRRGGADAAIGAVDLASTNSDGSGGTDDSGGGSDGGAPGGGGLPDGPFSTSATGLYGGSIQTIVIDPVTPTTIYAGTYGAGVWKSLDGGAHYAPFSVGLGLVRVNQLALDPAHPNNLWASVSDATQYWIYRSTDGAATWQQVMTTQGTAQVAVSSSDVYLLEWNATHHSTDGGATWTKHEGVLASTERGIELAVDPHNGKHAYLLSTEHLYKTTDGGASWAPFGDLPTTSQFKVYWSLTVDASASPTVIYVSTLGLGTGLYRSGDAGNHFASVAAQGAPINLGFGRIVIDPATPTTLFAISGSSGVWKSLDAGEHWGALDLGNPQGTVLSLARNASGTLFVGWYEDGLGQLLDGAAMQAAHAGITNVSVTAIAHAPSAPAIVYCGATRGQVWRSADGGASWSATKRGLPRELTIASLAVHPTDPTIVYAGAWKQNVRGALYKSLDSGDTWYELDLGASKDMQIVQVLVDPANPKVVYASGTELIRSDDAGVSFAKSRPSKGRVTIDPSNSQQLFMADHAWNTPARSTNGGDSWYDWVSTTKATNGIGVAQQATSVAVDPTDSAIVYVCTPLGPYKSADSGGTFSHAAVGFADPSLCAMLVSAPSDPQTLFAYSPWAHRLVVTHDGATTWSELPLGLSSATGEATIAVSPADASTVLVGLRDSVGILRTTTGGI